MMLTIRLFPIFIGLALLFSPAIAQTQSDDFQNFNPRFEVFPLPGGALGNSVQAIVQDSTGFLWFGSQQGLHRYDGQNFVTYRNDPLDSNSLASNYCEYIFLDSRGVLWLAHYNRGGVTAFNPAVGKVEVIPQDIGRVFLNLVNNAFYATQQRKTQNPDAYEPMVSISSHLVVPPQGGQGGEFVEFRIRDNGNGIPQKSLDKIFQTFFTTKPTGQGTGLGLSLSYDIIKAHAGEIKVETKEARPPARLDHSGGDDHFGRGEGSEFAIQLPI